MKMGPEGQVVDCKYLQANKGFEEQTGCRDVVGKSVSELDPEHLEFLCEVFGSVARTGSAVSLESCDVGLGGCYSLRASRFGDPAKGQVVVVFKDISERKVAQEALRRGEALFAGMIKQAPEGVFVIGERFELLQMNAGALGAFAGSNPVIGCDFAGILARVWGTAGGQRIARALQKTLQTGEPYLAKKFTLTREDSGRDETHDLSACRLMLPSGENVVVCYFTDTTERGLAAEALRVSEERANNVIQSITDGIITMDSQWRITYLSGRGAEILQPLGITTSNVIGKMFWEQFPAGIGTPAEESYRRAMDEQVTVQIETYYPPLGRWFDVRAYPSATGLSLYFLDITERKQATDAWRSSEQELRTADRSKDEFLAMLAHELRNPLAPLRNAAEILQSGKATEEEREHVQQLIVRQTDNMTRLIDDLLDVSRITEGKIELRREPVLLQTIVSNAVNAISPSCSAVGHKLNVALPAAPVILHADATRIEQVLGNLLGNACKYSGPGSRISLIAEALEGEAVIRIRDNGSGIDPKILPRIFDLFVQSSRTLDRAHGGLGIGLTIAHRLVVLHGGSIEAHSRGLGHGAEFVVRLPRITGQAEVAEEAAAAGEPSRTALKILIVDDNEDAAMSMATLQELEGHQTRVALNGPEAIRVAEEFEPAVVLLDIGLPGMDGFEVVGHLRRIPVVKDALMVALTGYGTQEDRERAKQAGFDEHLAKPANLGLLREWFGELVRKGTCGE